MIYAIFAKDVNGGFGFDNILPWPYVEYDTEHFVSKTLQHIVVMGYNTFLCLRTKPLENRLNIVVQNRTVSRLDEIYPCTLFVTFDELKPLLEKTYTDQDTKTKDIYILGGAKLIQSCINYIDAIYITHLLGEYKCNVYLDLDLLKTHFPIIVYRSRVHSDDDCSYAFEIRMREYNLVKIK
jgi:dihydrofolate reductase